MKLLTVIEQVKSSAMHHHLYTSPNKLTSFIFHVIPLDYTFASFTIM